MKKELQFAFKKMPGNRSCIKNGMPCYTETGASYQGLRIGVVNLAVFCINRKLFFLREMIR